MITAFQIVLLFVMGLTLLGVIGENKDINLRNNLAAICIVSILAFFVTELVLK